MCIEDKPSCIIILLEEPGYYEDGQFGIRLENIVMVKEEVDLKVTI